MRQLNQEKNRTFTDGIIMKYKMDPAQYYGSSLIHLTMKRESHNTDFHRHMEQIIDNHFLQKIKRYESRYYQMVTNKDNRRFLKTIEQIYNQPGEKKQMIHLLHKLGVVTDNQKKWQETTRRLHQYEEELVNLRKWVTRQEEYRIRTGHEEMRIPTVREVSQAVIREIKQEIRMERLRSGFD